MSDQKVWGGPKKCGPQGYGPVRRPPRGPRGQHGGSWVWVANKNPGQLPLQSCPDRGDLAWERLHVVVAGRPLTVVKKKWIWNRHKRMEKFEREDLETHKQYLKSRLEECRGWHYNAQWVLMAMQAVDIVLKTGFGRGAEDTTAKEWHGARREILARELLARIGGENKQKEDSGSQSEKGQPVEVPGHHAPTLAKTVMTVTDRQKQWIVSSQKEMQTHAQLDPVRHRRWLETRLEEGNEQHQGGNGMTEALHAVNIVLDSFPQMELPAKEFLSMEREVMAHWLLGHKTNKKKWKEEGQLEDKCQPAVKVGGLGERSHEERPSNPWKSAPALVGVVMVEGQALTDRQKQWIVRSQVEMQGYARGNPESHRRWLEARLQEGNKEHQGEKGITEALHAVNIVLDSFPQMELPAKEFLSMEREVMAHWLLGHKTNKKKKEEGQLEDKCQPAVNVGGLGGRTHEERLSNPWKSAPALVGVVMVEGQALTDRQKQWIVSSQVEMQRYARGNPESHRTWLEARLEEGNEEHQGGNGMTEALHAVNIVLDSFPQMELPAKEFLSMEREVIAHLLLQRKIRKKWKKAGQVVKCQPVEEVRVAGRYLNYRLKRWIRQSHQLIERHASQDREGQRNWLMKCVQEHKGRPWGEKARREAQHAVDFELNKQLDLKEPDVEIKRLARQFIAGQLLEQFDQRNLAFGMLANSRREKAEGVPFMKEQRQVDVCSDQSQERESVMEEDWQLKEQRGEDEGHCQVSADVEKKLLETEWERLAAERKALDYELAMREAMVQDHILQMQREIYTHKVKEEIRVTGHSGGFLPEDGRHGDQRGRQLSSQSADVDYRLLQVTPESSCYRRERSPAPYDDDSPGRLMLPYDSVLHDRSPLRDEEYDYQRDRMWYDKAMDRRGGYRPNEAEGHFREGALTYNASSSHDKLPQEGFYIDKRVDATFGQTNDDDSYNPISPTSPSPESSPRYSVEEFGRHITPLPHDEYRRASASPGIHDNRYRRSSSRTPSPFLLSGVNMGHSTENLYPFVSSNLSPDLDRKEVSLSRQTPTKALQQPQFTVGQPQQQQSSSHPQALPVVPSVSAVQGFSQVPNVPPSQAQVQSIPSSQTPSMVQSIQAAMLPNVLQSQALSVVQSMQTALVPDMPQSQALSVIQSMQAAGRINVPLPQALQMVPNIPQSQTTLPVVPSTPQASNLPVLPTVPLSQAMSLVPGVPQPPVQMVSNIHIPQSQALPVVPSTPQASNLPVLLTVPPSQAMSPVPGGPQPPVQMVPNVPQAQAFPVVPSTPQASNLPVVPTVPPSQAPSSVPGVSQPRVLSLQSRGPEVPQCSSTERNAGGLRRRKSRWEPEEQSSASENKAIQSSHRSGERVVSSSSQDGKDKADRGSRRNYSSSDKDQRDHSRDDRSAGGSQRSDRKSGSQIKDRDHRSGSHSSSRRSDSRSQNRDGKSDSPIRDRSQRSGRSQGSTQREDRNPRSSSGSKSCSEKQRSSKSSESSQKRVKRKRSHSPSPQGISHGRKQDAKETTHPDGCQKKLQRKESAQKWPLQAPGSVAKQQSKTSTASTSDQGLEAKNSEVMRDMVKSYLDQQGLLATDEVINRILGNQQALTGIWNALWDQRLSGAPGVEMPGNQPAVSQTGKRTVKKISFSVRRAAATKFPTSTTSSQAALGDSSVLSSPRNQSLLQSAGGTAQNSQSSQSQPTSSQAQQSTSSQNHHNVQKAEQVPMQFLKGEMLQTSPTTSVGETASTQNSQQAMQGFIPNVDKQEMVEAYLTSMGVQVTSKAVQSILKNDQILDNIERVFWIPQQDRKLVEQYLQQINIPVTQDAVDKIMGNTELLTKIKNTLGAQVNN